MDGSDRSSAMNETLRRLGIVVEGVRTCVVVGEDGFALAAYLANADGRGADDPQNATQVAAVVASLADTAERSLERLQQGNIGRLVLEGEAGTLLGCPAGPVTLALLVDPSASMGHVLFAAEKAAAEIRAILDPD